MTTHQFDISLDTHGRGFYELTEAVEAGLGKQRIQTGLCHVFVRHTSASVILCEKADPDVRDDLEALMSRMIIDGDPRYRHQNEGPDDMPAHARNVLAGCQLTLPVRGGRLGLGIWQGLYLWEHREAPLNRQVIVTVQGE